MDKRSKSKTPEKVATMLRILGRKWSFQVLSDIQEEDAITFNALRRKSENKISPNYLSMMLKEMQAEGIVSRKRIEEKVQYALTKYGESLHDSIIEMVQA